MRMKRDALCKNAILDSVSGKPEEEKCKSKRRSGSAYCQECSDRSRALKTKE
jgi:hypothetical protein